MEEYEAKPLEYIKLLWYCILFHTAPSYEYYIYNTLIVIILNNTFMHNSTYNWIYIYIYTLLLCYFQRFSI